MIKNKSKKKILYISHRKLLYSNINIYKLKFNVIVMLIFIQKYVLEF